MADTRLLAAPNGRGEAHNRRKGRSAERAQCNATPLRGGVPGHPPAPAVGCNVIVYSFAVRSNLLLLQKKLPDKVLTVGGALAPRVESDPPRSGALTRILAVVAAVVVSPHPARRGKEFPV